MDLFARIIRTSLEYSKFEVIKPFPSLYKIQMIVKDPVVSDYKTRSETKH